MYLGPLPPTDLLLRVARAATVLGDRHRHCQAVTVLQDTVRPHRSDSDGSGAAEREQCGLDADQGHVLRSERHRDTYHHDDPSGGDHHAELAAAPAVGGIVLPSPATLPAGLHRGRQ